MSLLNGFVGSVLFPRPPPSYDLSSFPGELLLHRHHSANADNSQGPVPCLFLPFRNAKYLVVYFNSNADDLGSSRWFCAFLRDQAKVHVLVLEYPGYGVCDGVLNRESIMARVDVAEHLATQMLGLPANRIIVFGRSVGTGLALQLAARKAWAGLILVSPFTSCQDLFREKVGPVAHLFEEWFPNEETIQKVQCPTLFIHGEEDELIAVSHGRTLFERCSATKACITPKNVRHNTDLTKDPTHLLIPLRTFFKLPQYVQEDCLRLPQTLEIHPCPTVSRSSATTPLPTVFSVDERYLEVLDGNSNAEPDWDGLPSARVPRTEHSPGSPRGAPETTCHWTSELTNADPEPSMLRPDSNDDAEQWPMIDFDALYANKDGAVVTHDALSDNTWIDIDSI